LAGWTGASGGVVAKTARVATPAASAASPRERTSILRTRRICFTSTRLGNGIDERRLALLDHLDGFLERRPEVLRIGDRALGPPALRPGEPCVIDVRRVDPAPDRPPPLSPPPHPLPPLAQP